MIKVAVLIHAAEVFGRIPSTTALQHDLTGLIASRTLAIGAFNTKLDDDFNILAETEEERAKIAAGMKAVEERIEADMDPIASARQMDTDEVVLVSELRERLVAWTEMTYQAMGVRRIKNPRIWSLHDLQLLTEA